jgi:hypothetical protein
MPEELRSSLHLEGKKRTKGDRKSGDKKQGHSK